MTGRGRFMSIVWLRRVLINFLRPGFSRLDANGVAESRIARVFPAWRYSLNSSRQATGGIVGMAIAVASISTHFDPIMDSVVRCRP